MSNLNLSVCIVTDKMTSHIDKTISDFKKLANEIIILDTSEKSNIKIGLIKNKKIKVITSKDSNNFSQWRNLCIKQAESEWILFLDSDEVISAELLENLPNLVLPTKLPSNENKNKIDGYKIRRIDFFHRQKIAYGEVGRVFKLRLARKKKYSFTGVVHEVGLVDGKVKIIVDSIYHYPHQSIASFFSKINHYSYLQAKDQAKYSQILNLFQLLTFPLAKFIVNYFFKFGFLDGFRGFIYAMMMSLHSLSVRVYLYEINKKI